MSEHFVRMCEFGEVHSQCRCRSPNKSIQRIECNQPDRHREKQARRHRAAHPKVDLLQLTEEEEKAGTIMLTLLPDQARVLNGLLESRGFMISPPAIIGGEQVRCLTFLPDEAGRHWLMTCPACGESYDKSDDARHDCEATR